MVRKQHKFLCLVLCLLLALSAVLVGTVSAFASTGDTVYVRANNGWTKLYCYMWTDGSGDNKSWPGVEMTKVSDDVYSYTLTGDYKKVIFNNGNNGAGQTGNLDYPGHGQIYDLTAQTWSAYDQAATQSTLATTATSATNATTATIPVSGGATVYLKNSAGWSSPNCYMWNSSSDSNKSWPGESMTSIGDDVWMYTASKAYANCIFNGGGSQTSDLTMQNGYIYDNSTNTWSVYDTSDLQVRSYTADPASGIYPDMDVTIKAAAVSKTGASVSYKFSVTNASGGTSVISDFSSNDSVIWTPASAGSYTITFDFKDSDGNENSRTLSLKVDDDLALVKPVIKSVAPANLNLIKVNAAATVSVTAGGGKTGTNLLFYKYVVTDPNGVQNTPYYTLNSTYTFTPAMAGEYSVNVYVQGSDNSTVNKTYTYTATGGDIPVPTTRPAQPTTNPAQPTTVPTTPVPATTVPTDPTSTSIDASTIIGDADGNGKVNVDDVTIIQKYIAEYPSAIKDIFFKNADLSGDNKLTVTDVTLLQKKIAGVNN